MLPFFELPAPSLTMMPVPEVDVQARAVAVSATRPCSRLFSMTSSSPAPRPPECHVDTMSSVRPPRNWLFRIAPVNEDSASWMWFEWPAPMVPLPMLRDRTFSMSRVPLEL